MTELVLPGIPSELSTDGFAVKHGNRRDFTDLLSEASQNKQARIEAEVDSLAKVMKEEIWAVL
jgi:hypothetical protein